MLIYTDEKNVCQAMIKYEFSLDDKVGNLV